MTYDAIILLGGSINNDGSLTPDNKRQVTEAVKLYRRAVAQMLITCGGQSYKVEVAAAASEAKAYARYAEKLGVPARHILSEESSRETIGNMYFAKKILLQYNWKRVIIIPAINHSTERVVYITKKVLGPEYIWTILRPHENTDLKNLAREQRSLETTKVLDDPITDGDHEAVYRTLCETHPAYGGTLFTLEELKALLEAN